MLSATARSFTSSSIRSSTWIGTTGQLCKPHLAELCQLFAKNVLYETLLAYMLGHITVYVASYQHIARFLARVTSLKVAGKASWEHRSPIMHVLPYLRTTVRSTLLLDTMTQAELELVCAASFRDGGADMHSHTDAAFVCFEGVLVLAVQAWQGTGRFTRIVRRWRAMRRIRRAVGRGTLWYRS